MKIEYQESFLRAAKAATNFSRVHSIDEYPLDIIKLINEDDNIKLLDFGEFARLTGTVFFRIPSTFGSSEAFHIRKGKKAIIVYNDMLPINRLRFTLAHEYGHFKMHHKGLNLNKQFTYRDLIRIKREEYEANTFASCLLFPLQVRYKYRNYIDKYEVAELFQISTQAAEIAISILDEHLSNGLDEVMSIYKDNHLDNYISYLEDMFYHKKEYLDSMYSEYMNDFSECESY